MSAYATAADFLARYSINEVVRLTNQDDPSATQPDLVKVQQALDDAEHTINSYLRAGGYDPALLAQYPPVELKRPEVAIARYLLNPYHEEGDPTRSEYDNVIDWLESLVKGQVQIVAPDPGGGQPQPTIASIKWQPGRRYWTSERIDSLI